MVKTSLFTKNYNHTYSFTFQGKFYIVYSAVILSENGKSKLGVTKDQVILTEHFTYYNGKECWTYEVGWKSGVNMPLRVTTDIPPEELIERVSIPGTLGYLERELFGDKATSYKQGKKVTTPDYKIPGLMSKWVIFILVCIGAMLFKDWYVKVIIWTVAGWVFGAYHHAYKNAFTTYIHDEDLELIQARIEARFYNNGGR